MKHTVQVLLLFVCPSVADIPAAASSLALDVTHHFATLTAQEARDVAGRTARFMVALDSEEDVKDGYTLVDCVGTNDGAERTVCLLPGQDIADEMTVTAKLVVLFHAPSVGVDGQRFDGFTESVAGCCAEVGRWGTRETKIRLNGTLPLTLQPLTYLEACRFIKAHHRHHLPAQSWKYGVALSNGSRTVGVVVVGRPVARRFDDGVTLEVTRCCTDGTKNTASMLYGSAWRVAKALGYRRLITYTLSTETGVSLTFLPRSWV